MKHHNPRRHPNPVYASTREQCSVCGCERMQRVGQQTCGPWFHPDEQGVSEGYAGLCRAPQERPERNDVAIKEVHIREVTCDRCRLVVQQSTDTTVLPDGWKAAYLGPEPNGEYIPGAFRELCPKCATGVEEAMRPLERVRRSSTAEQSALVTA